MNCIDLTLPTPEENLACDEALLEGCNAGAGLETLRFWEPQGYFVVVGYSNRVGQEVKVKACAQQAVPILRRCSGGGTVLQGPGCLNYALVLRIDSEPALQTVSGTNRFVMEQHRRALETLLCVSDPPGTSAASKVPWRLPKREIAVRGHTDLALGGRKFSGNAQRRKRHAVLFHGTFLLDFNLALVGDLLPLPSQEPEYRQGRAHRAFLANLALPAGDLKAALRRAWGGSEENACLPWEAIRSLVEQKYSRDDWNRKF
jgi:lipoate-protein ligase A